MILSAVSREQETGRAMSDAVVEQGAEALIFTRGKFTDPCVTADGAPRASIALDRLETLWINTGTLCNIECANCYIESSPSNDRLAYITKDEVRAYLDEIAELQLATREIAFTGGEPFMNPDMLAIARDSLSRGHDVLILTNAMQPMQRKRIKAGLLDLREEFGRKLTLRVSLDHYTKKLHETERGLRTWDRVVAGLDWLSDNDFRITIAGRTCWNEEENHAREGYADLIAMHGWAVDACDPSSLILFPELDEKEDMPEITSACWDILGVRPSDIMCSTSRMVVKRKGDKKPAVLPCTLLPYLPAFEMGSTLAEAAQADGGMFDAGAVRLCHPYCAKFCILGGGCCSG